MADLEKIAEELSNLTVLEASELSKILEEKRAKSMRGAGSQKVRITTEQTKRARQKTSLPLMLTEPFSP